MHLPKYCQHCIGYALFIDSSRPAQIFAASLGRVERCSHLHPVLNGRYAIRNTQPVKSPFQWWDPRGG